MLTEAGIKLDFELSDNELRYILWRSHQRLVNPGIYNPVTRITDVAVRARLGIGEYAPAVEEMSNVAEKDTAEMQESVMQGQTMFRMVTHEEAVRIANDFANTHKGATKKMVFSKGKETLAQQMRDAGFTELSIEVAMRNYDNGETPTEGAYYVSSDGIVLYEYKTEEEVNKILWHENTHRAITKLFGEDLTKIEEVYNGLPDSEKSNVIKRLEEKNYDAEDFPAESMCYFVEEAYLNKFLNSKYKLSYIVEKVNPEMKDFANFVQELIDYIDYGREGFESSGREGIERVGREGTENAGELYIEQQLPERNGESDANGTGADATEGAAETYSDGRESTRFRSTGETIENQDVAEGSIDDVKTAPMTLMERIINSLLEVSAKNKENLALRADALRTYGRDIKNVLTMMSKQREFALYNSAIPRQKRKAIRC